jgi:large subunit ribosomal protein L6
MPVPLPEGVNARVDGSRVTIEGPKGELTRTFDQSMEIALEDDVLRVSRPSDERRHKALHGLTRALLANMVTGVSEGYQKQLEIHGVGYRAVLRPDGSIEMHLGFSHPVYVEPPEGITFEVDSNSRVVTVRGADKELVGRVAAEIRAKRPPEPYKGKGVRYVGEHVRRKAGKVGKVI